MCSALRVLLRTRSVHPCRFLETRSCRRNGLVSSNATRVLIVSGHPLFRQGLQRLLSGQAGLDVIGVAVNGEEARQLIADLQPHTVIIDQDNSTLSDHDFLSYLREGTDLQLILLTLAEETMVIYRRQEVSRATLEELVSAIQAPCPRQAE